MPINVVKLPFPLKLYDEGWAFSRQPESTSPDALNVFAYNPITDRLEGSQRSGVGKASYFNFLTGTTSQTDATISFDTDGGKIVVQVTATGNWSLSLGTDASWLGINGVVGTGVNWSSGSASGSGNGTIIFNATGNESNGTRSASLPLVGSVGGDRSTPVQQSPMMFVAPTTLSFGPAGGTRDIAIVSNRAWTATVMNFGTLDQASGVGNDTITYTCPAAALGALPRLNDIYFHRNGVRIGAVLVRQLPATPDGSGNVYQVTVPGGFTYDGVYYGDSKTITLSDTGISGIHSGTSSVYGGGGYYLFVTIRQFPSYPLSTGVRQVDASLALNGSIAAYIGMYYGAISSPLWRHTPSGTEVLTPPDTVGVVTI